MSRPPRFGLVKARVAETIDLTELQGYARQGFTLNRAAHFLGVHWSTVERAARAHGVTFPTTYGARYGWQGVRPRPPRCNTPVRAARFCARPMGHAGAHQARGSGTPRP